MLSRSFLYRVHIPRLHSLLCPVPSFTALVSRSSFVIAFIHRPSSVIIAVIIAAVVIIIIAVVVVVVFRRRRLSSASFVVGVFRSLSSSSSSSLSSSSSSSLLLSLQRCNGCLLFVHPPPPTTHFLSLTVSSLRTHFIHYDPWIRCIVPLNFHIVALLCSCVERSAVNCESLH